LNKKKILEVVGVLELKVTFSSLLFSFLEKEVGFSRVLSSWDTSRETSDNTMSIRVSSRMNAFTSPRASLRNKIEWVWRLTNTRKNSLGTTGISITNRWFILNIWFNYDGSYREKKLLYGISDNRYSLGAKVSTTFLVQQ